MPTENPEDETTVKKRNEHKSIKQASKENSNTGNYKKVTRIGR